MPPLLEIIKAREQTLQRRSVLVTFGTFATYCLLMAGFYGLILFLFLREWFYMIWAPLAACIVAWAGYLAGAEVGKAERQLRLLAEEEAAETRGLLENARRDAAAYRDTLSERNRGFPSLMDAIGEYEAQKDQAVADYLAVKVRRAPRSAEIVKEESRRRREAERECRRTRAIIEYYEYIAPFLIELKEDVEPPDDNLLSDYDDADRADAVTSFLTKDEYRKLPATERNQMALDRFWARPKSKWLIGRLYERYVGYLYEQAGYSVEYFGIFKGYEDLGRDLICRKGKDVVVVQCKNWSQFRTIYEKHIFQFFGTVFQYTDANPGCNVRAAFYCSTSLSGLAKRFAAELGIEIKENFPFDTAYPCIKCNVSYVDGEKIYHLPFDQQYDKVKIELQRGEFYCRTVKEAETHGFRRAYSYHGADAR